MNPKAITEPDGTKVVELTLSYKDDTKGWVKRAFHPARKHLEMRDSHFDPGLPRWINPPGSIPLVPGKGTPTIVFLDLSAMKQLGVGYGELQTAKICKIHDLDSALHLKWLIRRYPDPAANLVPNIRIFRSRETSLVQSGHRITKIGLSGGKKIIVSRLLELSEEIPVGLYEETHTHQLLGKYEIDPQETILWQFDIDLQLELFT